MRSAFLQKAAWSGTAALPIGAVCQALEAAPPLTRQDLRAQATSRRCRRSPTASSRRLASPAGISSTAFAPRLPSRKAAPRSVKITAAQAEKSCCR